MVRIKLCYKFHDQLHEFHTKSMIRVAFHPFGLFVACFTNNLINHKINPFSLFIRLSNAYDAPSFSDLRQLFW